MYYTNKQIGPGLCKFRNQYSKKAAALPFQALLGTKEDEGEHRAFPEGGPRLFKLIGSGLLAQAGYAVPMRAWRMTSEVLDLI